jgi:hypothetical protein
MGKDKQKTVHCCQPQAQSEIQINLGPNSLVDNEHEHANGHANGHFTNQTSLPITKT